MVALHDRISISASQQRREIHRSGHSGIKCKGKNTNVMDVIDKKSLEALPGADTMVHTALLRRVKFT